MHVFSLTEKGRKLSQQLKFLWRGPISCYHKPQPFAEKVRTSFLKAEPLVLICATGIAVRILADVIKNKHQDPPVLVMDEKGRFVIPLLSGHEGGANDLAYKMADLLEATCVITTAESYIQPIITLGVGCERNCPLTYLEDLIQTALNQTQISVAEIQGIYSIDIKHDEPAIIAWAQQHQKPFHTFSVDQLKQVESQLLQYSDYVYKTVGVYGVAESAALFAAQGGTMSFNEKKARLLLPKIKNTKATCAIATFTPDGNIE